MSNRTNPRAKNPCGICRGWGFYRVSYDPDIDQECISCDNGERRETGDEPMRTKTMSHTVDPETSHLAAIQIDPHVSAQLKDALLILLDEKPRTADELTAVYANQAEVHRWPLILDLHNVKRRLSELHQKHHVIRPSGDKRPSRMGKASVVWELAGPVAEARVVVATS